MKPFIRFISTKALLLTLGLLSAGAQATLAQTMGTEQQAEPITDQTIGSALASYRDDICWLVNRRRV